MEQLSIDQLRAKRGKVKSSLTRMETFIGSVVPDDSNYFEFKVRFDKIDECWSTFDTIQMRLRAFDPGDQQAQEYDNADWEFEEMFFKTKLKLFQCMEQAALLFRTVRSLSTVNQPCESLPESMSTETCLESKQIQTFKQPEIGNLHVISSDMRCPVCMEDHVIFGCKNFQNSDVSSQPLQVKNLGLCYNCCLHGNKM